MRTLLLVASFVLLFTSCQKDSSSELDQELEDALLASANGLGLAFFQLPEPTDFSKIPQDPSNPLTEEKVLLGKLLFHESALGTLPVKSFALGTFSCASCHFASAGFQACKSQGIGEGGIGFGVNGESRARNVLYKAEELDVQPIRSPAALHVAYQPNILWNGQFGATHLNQGTEYAWTVGTPRAVNHLGFEGTEAQAIAGMEVHRLNLDKEWADQYGYTALFRAAFPGVSDEDLFTRKFAGLAIAAYERTLMANKAPFQRWLRGDRRAMTEKEKRGAIAFFRDANCNNCHTGPALSSMQFNALGMKDLHQVHGTFMTHPQNLENLGRGGFTQRKDDMYKFKVPQLYNLKDSPFYGHGSSFTSIREVIEYKNRAIKENASVPDDQLDPDFVPLHLSSAQIEDMTAFITFALRDPFLRRYQPEALFSGSCIPNNDPVSRSDLRCD